MVNLWVVFITGITTGGLSCMAVQGGLLASSLANQIEIDIAGQNNKRRGINQLRLALPITLFLIAKLVAYTLLGFLLGALGSILQLTPILRAILQFVIGIFMVGNALRMLNVHPIFRYFTFEPPAWLTRTIRRKAKNNTSLVTPIFLGVLTVFIPCGVTQTMMAAAVATGNALLGAALMFAFTLGTSPVFFVLAYFASRLSSLVEKQFVRIVAVILLVLGVLAFDTGLNLAGSPVSLTRLLQQSTNNPAPLLVNQPGTNQTSEATMIVLNALNTGYEPQTLRSPANTSVKLSLRTDTTFACTRAFLIPELNVQELLPVTGEVVVEIPPQPSGKVLAFTCSMGMYSGQIVFGQ